MPVGKPTDPAIKQEILDQIQNHGVPVLEMSRQYNIGTSVIYAWMKRASIDNQTSLAAELSRTKRELDNAYRIIGELTAKNSTPRLKR